MMLIEVVSYVRLDQLIRIAHEKRKTRLQEAQQRTSVERLFIIDVHVADDAHQAQEGKLVGLPSVFPDRKFSRATVVDDKRAALAGLRYEVMRCTERLRQDVIKKVFSNNSDFRSSSGPCFACRITRHVVKDCLYVK
ncbi:hypothetical protein DPMN_172670 [Dreissena polymorpha]|uniref:Uncharacterized protein n=1 Tax=Dreissena polymorpha TaxID=45954 RepID=A0A9D4E2Q6_DREPO|nr:hypothetical protein DPMN_172670 [Dreissena polymorpha]